MVRARPGDGGSFYLWGRAVTATFGVATVFLVYQVGMRWGARHALLAAGLMAVLPLHVRYSHYVLTDTLLTFFVTLTLLLSLTAHERGTLGGFVWAGAAAGLAAATKYNGGIALIMPLMACWMTLALRQRRLKAAIAAVAACGVAFLVFAPYTLLDLPAFLDNFARLAREYRVATVAHDPVWLLYLKYLVRHTFGWPALLLAGGGIGRHGTRDPRTRPRAVDACRDVSTFVFLDAEYAANRLCAVPATPHATAVRARRRCSGLRCTAAGATKSPAQPARR